MVTDLARCSAIGCEESETCARAIKSLGISWNAAFELSKEPGKPCPYKIEKGQKCANS